MTGGASSSIHTFCTKLRTLQAKHSFSLCLALDLFSDIPDDSLDLAELIAGKIDVPVQVYVAVGGGKLPSKIVQKMQNGEEVCKNVMVLGTSLPVLEPHVRWLIRAGSRRQGRPAHARVGAQDRDLWRLVRR